MAEQWRRIPRWPGVEASSDGRIRTVDRTLADGRAAGGVVLAQSPDKDGYLRVTIGRQKVPVHVLVCLAFHGPPEVRHLGESNQDNRPAVLAWGSRRDNERDKKRQKGKEKRAATRPSGVGTPGMGELR